MLHSITNRKRERTIVIIWTCHRSRAANGIIQVIKHSLPERSSQHPDAYIRPGGWRRSSVRANVRSDLIHVAFPYLRSDLNKITSVWPDPVTELLTIGAVLMSISQVPDNFVLHLFFQVGGPVRQSRHAIDDIDDKGKAVGLIKNCQLQWRIDVALLLVTPNMQVFVVLEAIGQLVYQPWITMEVEDHWLVGSKQTVEFPFCGTVRVLARRLYLVQVNHINETHLQVRQMFTQEGGCTQCLLGRYVATGS